MATTLLENITQEDYEKARFLSKRKFENDLESEKNTAIKIAMYEAAKEILRYGDSIEKISTITKLSVDEIKKIELYKLKSVR